MQQPQDSEEEAAQSIDLLQGQGIFTTVEEFRGAWHEAQNTTAVYYSISVDEASSLVVEEEEVEDEELAVEETIVVEEEELPIEDLSED